MSLISVVRKTFRYGQIDTIEARSIPKTAASRALNFLTKGDKIELRRGMDFLGTSSVNTGVGRISGSIKVTDALGVQHAWRSRGRKIEYFSRVTSEWVELSTNLLPVAADGEDITFSFYASPAGWQLWFSSPHSSLYKVMIANPDDYSDQYDSTKNYKGKINIRQSRMVLWQRVGNETDPHLSYIDDQNYTTVTAEAIGIAGSLTYSGTLAFKAGDAKRTCFGVTFTDGVETFTDNYNGLLTGSAGGTGTINYMTGAYSVTFAVVAAGPVTSTYQWEISTNGGIADFSKSATRLAGQGAIFPQGFGKLHAVVSLNDVEYCFHEQGIYALTLSADDTNATNNPYRERTGVSNHLGVFPTGSGIYYVDTFDRDNAKIRVLTFETGSTEVIPIAISNNLDLSNYDFEDCAIVEYGDFVLTACKETGETENNRVVLYHTIWKSFDWLDYFVSNFLVYDGVLHAGDSISNNVAEIFSGFDDDDSLIAGFFEGAIDNLDIENLKKCKNLIVQGEIGPDQSCKVYLGNDLGAFVEITDNDGLIAISGAGDYVDRTQAVNVGSLTLGRGEVGGGGSGVSAYNYERIIPLRLDTFEFTKIKFEPQGLGYFSLSTLKYHDVRLKGQRVPRKYRV